MINHEQFLQFIDDYYHGRYPHQRLGQAFLNVHFPHVSDSYVFHETDDAKALDLIESEYVQDKAA